jgi:hypothetical protein
MTTDQKRSHLDRGLELHTELEDLQARLTAWYEDQTELLEQWTATGKQTGTLTLRGFELGRARAPDGSTLDRAKRELEKRMTELDRAFKFPTEETTS